jgi:hypothetical protein
LPGLRHLAGLRRAGLRHLGPRHLGPRHLGPRHLGLRHPGLRHLPGLRLPGLGDLSRLPLLPRLGHLPRVDVPGGLRLRPFDGSSSLLNRSRHGRRALARGASPAVAGLGPTLFGPTLAPVATPLALTGV